MRFCYYPHKRAAMSQTSLCIHTVSSKPLGCLYTKKEEVDKGLGHNSSEPPMVIMNGSTQYTILPDNDIQSFRLGKYIGRKLCFTATRERDRKT